MSLTFKSNFCTLSDIKYLVHSYCSGNHERDWPNTGSFFDTPDSGGECGVPAETMYYFPAENRAKFWYATLTHCNN